MSNAVLGLRLKQQLTLTPRLQQSVKLLQLSALECVQELHQAIAQNPFLEESVETPESTQAEEAAADAGTHADLDFSGSEASSGDDTPDCRTCGLHRTARRDDEIGAATLLRIRHLKLADPFQPFPTHARPPQHALILPPCRCRHDRDKIDPTPAALFEQQRDVDHHQRFGPVSPQEGSPSPLDLGMDQRFQSRQGGSVMHHDSTEPRAIDPGGAGHAWMERLDRRQ